MTLNLCCVSPQDARGSGDQSMLTEMMFGATPIAYQGVMLKLHKLR